MLTTLLARRNNCGAGWCTRTPRTGLKAPGSNSPRPLRDRFGIQGTPKIPYRNARPYEALAIPPVGVGRTRVTALHRAARPCIALVARGEIKRNHPRGYTRRNSQRSAPPGTSIKLYLAWSAIPPEPRAQPSPYATNQHTYDPISAAVGGEKSI